MSGSRVPGIVVTTLVAIIVIACGAQAKEFRFDYHDTLAVDNRPDIDVSFPDGRVEIIGSDSRQIIIEATKIIHAVGMDDAQAIADGFTIDASRSGDHYHLNADFKQQTERKRSLWKKLLGNGEIESYGSLEWTIQVPSDCDLNVSSQHGGISISHIQGDVTVKGSSAEIELASLEGTISVLNTSGSTSGEFLFGNLTVRQAMGNVNLQWIEGDTRVKSTSANISLVQERGAIDIETVAGNVDIATRLNSTRDYYVETESGHIRLAIPETSSADLRIETQIGQIKIDVPVSVRTMTDQLVEGVFGYGGVHVSLHSVSGDVTVAQQ